MILDSEGLAQDCSNSSALAMELLQSCAKPLNYVSYIIISLITGDIRLA